jgi:pimeloyl-ACP methyl ester carboxylesterase
VRGRGVVAVALVALLLAFGWTDGFLTGLARGNLSNDGFRRAHERVPSDVGVPYENVTIPSGGLLLAGWWMPADPPGGANASTTVVLVHGLGSTMGKPVRLWAASLHGAGYSLLALDLRNHGASPDTPDGLVTYGAAEADDVAAAVAYARARTGGPVVLYGGSMGAATVLEAASRGLPGVVGAVADSSYASFRFQARLDGAEQGYPAWLVDLVVARMDAVAAAPPSSVRPDESLPGLGVPVLLAHCADDGRVGRANFDRLAAVAPPGTATWIADCPTGVSPDRHLDGFMQPGYNATVLAFLGRL